MNDMNCMLVPGSSAGAWAFCRYLTNGWTADQCRMEWPDTRNTNNPVHNKNGAKTMLFTDENGKLFARVLSTIYPMNVGLMPDFASINVIDNNGSNKVVIVEFTDGTKQKAVLDNGDSFSLEQGISICVAKKLFDVLSPGNGSSLYNKIVTRGLNAYKKIQTEKQKAAEKAEREKEKYNKLVNKKRKKHEKREAARREAEIELQKEAYLRAMREYNSAPCDEAAKD